MTEFHTIWIEQCEAARGIEDDFGTQQALDYLVGEKFLNYLEAAMMLSASFKWFGIVTVLLRIQCAVHANRFDLVPDPVDGLDAHLAFHLAFQFFYKSSKARLVRDIVLVSQATHFGVVGATDYETPLIAGQVGRPLMYEPFDADAKSSYQASVLNRWFHERCIQSQDAGHNGYSYEQGTKAESKWRTVTGLSQRTLI
jgi:hypothetical protein